MPTPAKERQSGISFRRIVLRSGVILLVALFGLVSGSCRRQGPEVTLGSGPSGGTFEKIAAGMAQVFHRDIPGVRFVVKPTGGSLANLFDVNQGRLSMGMVFSGDAYLGWKGKLRKGLPPTTHVRALARLYGATAQLVVPGPSSIRRVEDLRGRRVAIGGSGTGSALTARRYFQSIGLWGRIIPIHEGYATGVEDLKMGNIDAVWLEVGFPNEYLLSISEEVPLRFLDLTPAAKAGDFFSRYPFYTPTVIPAGTYLGQEREVLSFQDAALWVAGAGTSEDLVFSSLRALFSTRGLKLMQAAHPVAQDISLAKGLQGVKIPLHPGARKFWREKGMLGEGR
jgi:TRAP transporter TAXI family solute receptor